MGDTVYEMFSMLWDMIIIAFVIVALAIIMRYMIRDGQLQQAQHMVTRQANVASHQASKTGDGGTLEYGEPFTVSRERNFNFFGRNINLEEVRSGVNRGKFTTEGYVYR